MNSARGMYTQLKVMRFTHGERGRELGGIFSEKGREMKVGSDLTGSWPQSEAHLPI